MTERGKFYKLLAIAFPVLGLMDFLATALILNGAQVTFDSAEVRNLIIQTNVVLFIAIFIWLGLFRRYSIALWAGIALPLVYFSFMLLWMQQRGEWLQTTYPAAFYVKIFAVMPLLVLLPIGLSVVAMRAARSRKAGKKVGHVMIHSPEMTPAEPKM